jgi:CPA1 family monovalent cation:H+ antiporter
MRGGVSLAAALALPLTATGHAFPDRSNVIVIAYIVIVATLVIPGLTLSPLIRRLGLAEEEALARQGARARLAVAHAALGHVEVMAEREKLPEQVSDAARLTYERRIDRLEPGGRRRRRRRRRGCDRSSAARAATGVDRSGAQSAG